LNEFLADARKALALVPTELLLLRFLSLPVPESGDFLPADPVDMLLPRLSFGFTTPSDGGGDGLEEMADEDEALLSGCGVAPEVPSVTFLAAPGMSFGGVVDDAAAVLELFEVDPPPNILFSNPPPWEEKLLLLPPASLTIVRL
jgi:hypothetical protein